MKKNSRTISDGLGECHQQKTERRVFAFRCALSALVVATAMNALAQDNPSTTSPVSDLALNKDTSLSDDGWGGGTSKTDIVSGNRIYGPYDPSGFNQWARGLALPWDGQAHQITIDFGSQVTIGSVIQWHHGAGPGGMQAETPASYSIEYWDHSTNVWSTVLSTTHPENFLKYPNAVDPQDWWAYWSTPYENFFSPVTSDKLRIWMTPQPGRYNWVWQVEAYSPLPEPASLAVFGIGIAALAFRFLRR